MVDALSMQGGGGFNYAKNNLQQVADELREWSKDKYASLEKIMNALKKDIFRATEGGEKGRPRAEIGKSQFRDAITKRGSELTNPITSQLVVLYG